MSEPFFRMSIIDFFKSKKEKEGGEEDLNVVTNIIKLVPDNENIQEKIDEFPKIKDISGEEKEF